MQSEDGTARGFFLAPEDKTQPNVVIDDTPSGSVAYTEKKTRGDFTVFTSDMVELLRQKLREAEAREEREHSGVRMRIVDSEDEIDIDIEPPRTLDELEEVLSPLPELEVALAPNSESNFYAGFDETHPDGVFFATYERYAIGTPLYATIHLPAGFSFRAAAMVEWVRDSDTPGLGLKLCGLDTRAWGLIASFVRNRRPMFYLG
jgi:hypothetical protein